MKWEISGDMLKFMCHNIFVIYLKLTRLQLRYFESTQRNFSKAKDKKYSPKVLQDADDVHKVESNYVSKEEEIMSDFDDEHNTYCFETDVWLYKQLFLFS